MLMFSIKELKKIIEMSRKKMNEDVCLYKH